MYFSRRLCLSLLACGLLLGLSLPACGGSGATNSSGPDSMTLKVAQVNKSIFFFPLYIALQKNFIKDQGLTLDPPTPPVLGSGSKLSTAVEANSVEVGVGGMTDVFTLSRVDSSIKIIGAVTNAFLQDVVMSKRFEQQTHLSPTSPLTEKVKALVGKKVGISAPNSASDALVTYLFRQQGLDSQKDVTKVNLTADIPTNIAALQAGRVDATVVAAPGGELAQVQNVGDILISPVRGDVPAMQGQLFGIAFAKQSTIDSKPKAVQAFIRAIAQAETFIQKNPAQATALLGKYLKLNQKALNASWNATKSSMPTTPQISQQAYDTANQFHVKAGLIAVELAYNDLVAVDTINKALNGMPAS